MVIRFLIVIGALNGIALGWWLYETFFKSTDEAAGCMGVCLIMDGVVVIVLAVIWVYAGSLW